MTMNHKTRHSSLRHWCVILLMLLAILPVCAQESLKTLTLFDKYGDRQDVTRVELNGDILKSYRMTTYKSIVFKDVSGYQKEVEQCLKQDVAHSLQVKKTQEVVEKGILLSAYYQLTPVKQRKRYLLFKRGKANAASLVYIEGSLSEKELMEILFKGKK